MLMQRESYLVDLNAFDGIEYSHDAEVKKAYVGAYPWRVREMVEPINRLIRCLDRKHLCRLVNI